MKNSSRTIAAILALIVALGAVAFASYAKDLEVCRLCGGKGDYHCSSCGNTGIVTCDACGGAGSSKCPGDVGRGHACDNGKYTCPSCNGDGRNRSGDGKIIEGSCGECGGAGKLTCVVCRGNGRVDCERCGGAGETECQVETCKVSRQYGWKCPDCKGTGYILVGNPMPSKESNDGYRNVPSSGDYIVTNDKTWEGYTYGGSGGSGSSGTESSPPPVDTAQNPETTPPDTEKDVPPEDDGTSDSRPDLPEVVDRSTGFEIPAPDGNDGSSASRIEPDKMTEAERRRYEELSEEELLKIVQKVADIVASASPGRSDPDLDALLKELASDNGFDSPEDGKLYPLYFEGHIDIGFPLRVTVTLEKGALGGGGPIFVYHLSDDKDVEPLGEAEYVTYDDGSVESLSFYTSSFSTFFTSKNEIKIKNDDAAEPVAEVPGVNFVPLFLIIIASVVVLLIAAAFILNKKRKK